MNEALAVTSLLRRCAAVERDVAHLGHRRAVGRARTAVDRPDGRTPSAAVATTPAPAARPAPAAQRRLADRAHRRPRRRSAGAATTGVVLGDIHLTANVFSKLSVVPDLVVLNACHLGRVLTGANAVAASVGRALLGLGVRAVVVAGWAVDDAAPRRSPRRCTTSSSDGADFGGAVQAARRAAWEVSGGSLTWGAYQCYGDPGFALTSRVRRRATPRGPHDRRAASPAAAAAHPGR